MCPLTGIHVESRSSSLSVDKEAASPERDTFVDIDTSDLLVAILSHGDIWFAELQGLQAETILIPMCPFWTQSYIYFDFYQNMVFLAYVPGAAALFVQRGCVTAVSEPAPH